MNKAINKRPRLGSQHREEIQEKTTIACLYPELLSIIFSHLDLRDKGRVAQVCWNWKEAAYDKSVWIGVEAKLHLSNNHRANYHLLQSLVRRGIKKIQILSLHKGLKEVTIIIKNLERLILAGCYNLTDEKLGPALSEEMPSLTQLSLGMCKQITDRIIYKIASNLKNLEYLDLGGCCGITDSSLRAIENGLKKLKHLNLRSCRITDSGISNLCSPTYHHEDSLGHRRNYADPTNESLPLEFLDLQDCQALSDDALEYISIGLVHLKSINLSFCVGISDIGLKHISSISSLKELDLRSCSNITDTGLRYLSEAGLSLSVLDVSFCENIGDSGLTYLAQGQSNLVTLSLNSCSISDEGIIKLSRTLAHLKTLNIGQCNGITDKGLNSLAENCLNLENIDLYGCTRITTSGLEKIMQLPLLNFLNLGLWQNIQKKKALNESNGNTNQVELWQNPSVMSHSQFINQYKNLIDCNENGVIFSNCIVTKLCNSCQNVNFLLNRHSNGSQFYILLRVDKS